MGDNLFGNEGARSLADALKVNTTLLRLDVRYNNIDLKEYGPLQNRIQVNNINKERMKELRFLCADKLKRPIIVEEIRYNMCDDLYKKYFAPNNLNETIHITKW